MLPKILVETSMSNNFSLLSGCALASQARHVIGRFHPTIEKKITTDES
jgi:hypothetical protein